VIEPVFRAGETYPLPGDISRDDAFAYWRASGNEVFVAEDGGRIVGTYYLRANNRGGGSHVANCGYIVAANVSRRGVARAMCVHSLERARGRGFTAMQFNFVIKAGVNAGIDAYEAARSVATEADLTLPTKKIGRTNLIKIHSMRARREAFLLVADMIFPVISEFVGSRVKMLKMLSNQAKQPELFRNYFGRCQTALEALGIDNPSAATLRAWSGVDALPMDDILPLTKEERESLGIFASVRRSAETTHRAHRQGVPRSKPA
jgi:hypothetical protein